MTLPRPWMLFVIMLTAPAASRADSILIPLKISSHNRLSFSLPYTLGTHSGEVIRLETGSVTWNQEARTLGGIELSFKVTDIEIDGATLKCHMRESLELDYNSSEFPESHVCSGDQLPKDGPNSPRYPTVSFKSKPGASLSLKEADPALRKLSGELTLHGISREKDLLITELREDQGKVHIEGSLQVPLNDFGIEVKPFLFVKVGEQAKVEWTLTLDLPLKMPQAKAKHQPKDLPFAPASGAF